MRCELRRVANGTVLRHEVPGEVRQQVGLAARGNRVDAHAHQAGHDRADYRIGHLGVFPARTVRAGEIHDLAVGDIGRAVAVEHFGMVRNRCCLRHNTSHEILRDRCHFGRRHWKGSAAGGHAGARGGRPQVRIRVPVGRLPVELRALREDRAR
jgi:hypothetical protein